MPNRPQGSRDTVKTPVPMYGYQPHEQTLKGVHERTRRFIEKLPAWGHIAPSTHAVGAPIDGKPGAAVPPIQDDRHGPTHWVQAAPVHWRTPLIDAIPQRWPRDARRYFAHNPPSAGPQGPTPPLSPSLSSSASSNPQTPPPVLPPPPPRSTDTTDVHNSDSWMGGFGPQHRTAEAPRGIMRPPRAASPQRVAPHPSGPHRVVDGAPGPSHQQSAPPGRMPAQAQFQMHEGNRDFDRSHRRPRQPPPSQTQSYPVPTGGPWPLPTPPAFPQFQPVPAQTFSRPYPFHAPPPTPHPNARQQPPPVQHGSSPPSSPASFQPPFPDDPQLASDPPSPVQDDGTVWRHCAGCDVLGVHRYPSCRVGHTLASPTRAPPDRGAGRMPTVACPWCWIVSAHRRRCTVAQEWRTIWENHRASNLLPRPEGTSEQPAAHLTDGHAEHVRPQEEQGARMHQPVVTRERSPSPPIVVYHRASVSPPPPGPPLPFWFPDREPEAEDPLDAIPQLPTPDSDRPPRRSDTQNADQGSRTPWQRRPPSPPSPPPVIPPPPEDFEDPPFSNFQSFIRNTPVVPGRGLIPTPPPSPGRGVQVPEGPQHSPYVRARTTTPLPTPILVPTPFPAVVWVPHPQPHPQIPAQMFFQTSQPAPAGVLDAAAVARITGGWPLPGTLSADWRPPQWPPVGGHFPLMTPTMTVNPWGALVNGPYAAVVPTPASAVVALPTPFQGPMPIPATPGQVAAAVPPSSLRLSPWGPVPILCPYLIPNPGNGIIPWLKWDVRFPPALAQRVTARRTVVSVANRFPEPATHPPVPCVHIAYNLSVLGMLNGWGAIIVNKARSGGGTVTFGDILEAIYDFFQTPLTQPEARELQTQFPAIWRQMCGAFKKRCEVFPAIPEVTWSQGMRRVDCLGDRHVFWGMWVTHNADRTFYLNLGLIPPSQRV